MSTPIERLQTLAKKDPTNLTPAQAYDALLALPDLIAAVEAAREFVQELGEYIDADVGHPEELVALRAALAPLYRPQGPAGGEEARDG